MRYLPRPSKYRFTVASLMIAIALFAGLFNALRPSTHAEAIRSAEIRLRKFASAANWAGEYEVGAWWAGTAWLVDFVDPDSGEHLAQISVTSRGKAFAPNVNKALLPKATTTRAPR